MSNWDDEDFQPAIPAAKPKIVDKWEGEDEEEEVKDSWEDFGDEEKKPESGDAAASAESKAAAAAAAEKKKKKKMADIIAEKERKKLEEKEKKKVAEANEPQDRPLTEAERIALEEERELEIARETFGTDKEPSGTWDFPLANEQDLRSFREALVAKLEKRTAPMGTYVTFLEDLLRDLCVTLDTDDIKKLSATVNAIHNEKVNASKAGGKSKKGKKGRANLNVGAKNVADDDAYYGTGYDDYDDFI